MCNRRFVSMPFIAIAIAALLSTVVMLLWNALLPPLFNVGTIGFWQALGLLVLSRILFGGFHHGWRNHHRPPFFLRDRWSKLTDEEREKLRNEWHSRWCCGPERREPPTDSPS